jgi:hypothetical protein
MKSVGKRKKVYHVETNFRLHLENEQRERDLMEVAESESRTYERAVKYQIEEKERRDWEKTEISSWEDQLVKNLTDWKTEAQERESVRGYHYIFLTSHSGKNF